jgi:hypothetical protein
LSVADALSWAVSHAEGRVTQAIGIALTAPIYEFATLRDDWSALLPLVIRPSIIFRVTFL